MPISRGEIAGGIAVDVTHRHVHVVAQQGSHDFPPSLRSRKHQSCKPLPFVDNIRVGASFQEQTHRFVIWATCGIHQCSSTLGIAVIYWNIVFYEQSHDVCVSLE